MRNEAPFTDFEGRESAFKDLEASFSLKRSVLASDMASAGLKYTGTYLEEEKSVLRPEVE